MKENKKLLSIFMRSFFIQSVWNFESLQNVGFAYGLLPFIRLLYPDPIKRKEIILRHLGFFNTHPYMVNVILGIVASMEEELKDGQRYSEEDITSLKTNMAGPLAAIGDTFFWATWRPFSTLMGASLILFFFSVNTFWGTWLGPLFFLAVYNMAHLTFRYMSLKISYRLRVHVIKIIANLEFQRAVDIVRIVALLMLVFVVTNYIFNFSFNIFNVAIFFLVFLFTIILGSYRVPPRILFYGSIVLCVVIKYLTK